MGGSLNLPSVVFGAAPFSQRYNVIADTVPLRTVRLALRYFYLVEYMHRSDCF